jgi:hypothetical protein
LGAGVGLSAMCMLRHCAPARLTLTDGDATTLANLEHNLHLNDCAPTPPPEGAEQRPDGPTQAVGVATRVAGTVGHTVVECRRLLWGEGDATELHALRAEVVVGADIVYALTSRPIGFILLKAAGSSAATSVASHWSRVLRTAPTPLTASIPLRAPCSCLQVRSNKCAATGEHAAHAAVRAARRGRRGGRAATLRAHLHDDAAGAHVGHVFGRRSRRRAERHRPYGRAVAHTHLPLSQSREARRGASASPARGVAGDS